MKRTFKKILSVILTVATLFSMTSTAFAAGGKSDKQLIRKEFEYTVIEDSAIVQYSGNETDTLVIPGTYQGYPVKLMKTTFHFTNYFKKVVLSDGVKVIDKETFNGCKYLTELEIGSTVEEIAYNALWAPNLRSITVAEDNPYFSSVDGVLFNKEKTKLIYYPMGKNASSYSVPDGVTALNSFAIYNNTNLENLTLPAGIEVIGYASANESLKNIYIPDSLKEFRISDRLSSEANIYFEGTQEEWQQVMFSTGVVSTIHYDQAKNPLPLNDSEEAAKDSAEDEELQKAKRQALIEYWEKGIFGLPAATMFYTLIGLIFTGASIGTGLQKIIAFLLPWIDWTF